MNIFNFFKRKIDKSAIQKVFTNSSDFFINKDATSFAAIDLICSSFANLSGYFYDKRTKQSIKDHFLYELLQNPNYDESKFTFFIIPLRIILMVMCFGINMMIAREI
jgi:hypothetical protein